jgi:hypothetical protein
LFVLLRMFFFSSLLFSSLLSSLLSLSIIYHILKWRSHFESIFERSRDSRLCYSTNNSGFTNGHTHSGQCIGVVMYCCASLHHFYHSSW